MEKRVCLVLFICFCTLEGVFSTGIIFNALRQGVRQTKCKLHQLGSKIIHHDHKYGDPCEQRGEDNIELNEIDVGGTNEESGYFDGNQYLNGHSYGNRDNNQPGYGHESLAGYGPQKNPNTQNEYFQGDNSFPAVRPGNTQYVHEGNQNPSDSGPDRDSNRGEFYINTNQFRPTPSSNQHITQSSGQYGYSASDVVDLDKSTKFSIVETVDNDISNVDPVSSRNEPSSTSTLSYSIAEITYGKHTNIDLSPVDNSIGDGDIANGGYKATTPSSSAFPTNLNIDIRLGTEEPSSKPTPAIPVPVGGGKQLGTVPCKDGRTATKNGCLEQF